MQTATVKIEWWQVIAVGVGTLVVSYLVLLIPSFIVRKIQPVKAIRFQ
jgi:lipoprotein-releasing system permease protein